MGDGGTTEKRRSNDGVSAAVGLFYMQRYRFLTIDQYARVTQKNRSTESDRLRHMQRLGLLGFFGYVGLIGHGKTPNVYFLTRKGFDLLETVREKSLKNKELLPRLSGL